MTILNPKFLILCLLTLLMGCSASKHSLITEVPVQYKERVVERLVPYAVAADSSTLKAWFECDSLNQVIIKQLDEQKGKSQSNIDFNNGKLTYKLIHKVDTVYVAAKDSFIYKEKAIRVEVPIEVNKLTNWQIIQIYAGKVMLSILVLGLIYLLFKMKTKLLNSI